MVEAREVRRRKEILVEAEALTVVAAEVVEAGSITEKREVMADMRTTEAMASTEGTEALGVEAAEAIGGVITAGVEQATLRTEEPLEVTRMEGQIISRLSGNDKTDKRHVGKRHYEGKFRKPCLWCFRWDHYQMDPICPRYGQAPAPLPKSMFELFPVSLKLGIIERRVEI